MKNQYLNLGLLILLVISSCSKKEINRNTGSAPGPTKNKSELLSRLSPEDRKRYETWESSIVKTCDVSAIFQNEKGETYIDLSRLGPASSQGFLNIKEQTLLFGKTKGINGYFKRSIETMNRVNDQEYLLEASSQISNSTCIIKLFGKTIFENKLGKSIRIAGHIRPNLKKDQETEHLRISTSPTGSSKITVEYFSIPRSFFSFIEPDQSSLDLIGGHLSLPPNTVSKLFKITKGSNALPSTTFKLQGPFKTNWFSRNADSLVFLGMKDLALLFNRKNHDIEAFLSFGPMKGQVYKIKAKLTAKKEGPNAIYKIHSYQKPTKVDSPDQLASRCFIDRLNSLLGRYKTLDRIMPSINEIKNSCEIFNYAFATKLRKSNSHPEIFRLIFSSYGPDFISNFAGWRDLFFQEIMFQDKKGTDLLARYHNGGLNPKVTKAIKNYLLAKDMLKEFPRLASDAKAIFKTVVTWGLNGQESIPNDLRQIINGLNNTIDVLRHSAMSFLQKLDRSSDFSIYPDYWKTDLIEQLAYMQNLDGIHKILISKATILAEKKGQHSWIKDHLNFAIQNRLSKDFFRAAIKKFEAL